jgi:hypothetical protein
LCYGQSVSRTTYVALWNVIGTKYGTPLDGATFKLPDLRGRTTFARDNMGGTAAGRIDYMNPAVTPIDPYTLGAGGGVQYEQVPFSSSNVAISGSSGVSGNLWAVVGGTMYGYTQGALSVHVWGNSTNTDGWGGSAGGGPLVGSHSHWIDIWGDTSGQLRTYVNEGNMQGNASGSLSGWCSATGGTVSGTTGWASNLPPLMMMNKIISTGGV